MEPKHLLSGIALCGKCGRAMRPNMHKVREDGKHRKPAYSCPGCMKLTRQMEPVDELVNEFMIRLLSMPDAAAAVAVKPDALRAALTARDAVLARMDTVADSFAQGDVTARQFARMNEQLKAQLEAAERDVQKLQPNRILDGMTGPGAAAAWAVTSLERKRTIIRDLVEITILPSGPGVKFADNQVRFTPKAAS
jgi:site-specific DNA recombinase